MTRPENLWTNLCPACKGYPGEHRGDETCLALPPPPLLPGELTEKPAVVQPGEEQQ